MYNIYTRERQHIINIPTKGTVLNLFLTKKKIESGREIFIITDEILIIYHREIALKTLEKGVSRSDPKRIGSQ